MLAAAVALLHLQLRGEDTAVELQVELTGVDRRIRPVLGAKDWWLMLKRAWLKK